MESPGWRRRVHPTIEAAVLTGIVVSNYCRARGGNATDLRLHPETLGHWALNVAYIAGVACHGKLETGVYPLPTTIETARLRRNGVHGPVHPGCKAHLGPNDDYTRAGAHIPQPKGRNFFVLQNHMIRTGTALRATLQTVFGVMTCDELVAGFGGFLPHMNQLPLGARMILIPSSNEATTGRDSLELKKRFLFLKMILQQKIYISKGQGMLLSWLGRAWTSDSSKAATTIAHMDS